MPDDPDAPEFIPTGLKDENKKIKKKKDDDSPTLFSK